MRLDPAVLHTCVAMLCGYLFSLCQVPNATDVHLFRDGIKPTWEDPSNSVRASTDTARRGGRSPLPSCVACCGSKIATRITYRHIKKHAVGQFSRQKGEQENRPMNLKRNDKRELFISAENLRLSMQLRDKSRRPVAMRLPRVERKAPMLLNAARSSSLEHPVRPTRAT